MGKEHYAYIDFLKGFLMFLVVWGHYLQLSIMNGEGSVEYISIINEIRGLFCMPLFMFISGFLFYKSLDRIGSWCEVGIDLRKRFMVLVIPFFVSGAILYLTKGMFFIYWFLLTIFEFALVCAFIRYGMKCLFPDRGERILPIIWILLIICVIVWDPSRRSSAFEPFLDVKHMSMFPYFLMGMLARQFSWLKKLAADEWGFIISLVLSGGMYFLYKNAFADSTLLNGTIRFFLVISLFGVIIYVFSNINHDTRFSHAFQVLGRGSLEIYILHFFFLFNSSINWTNVGKIFSFPGGEFSLLVMQLIVIFIQTIFTLFFCNVVTYFLKTSPKLYSILLGRRV